MGEKDRHAQGPEKDFTVSWDCEGSTQIGQSQPQPEKILVWWGQGDR